MNAFLFAAMLFVAMFIQAITGFGGPLIAMPLGIVLMGVEVAKPVITVCAWSAAMLVAVPAYRYINWKESLKMTAIMFAGVLAGLWFFNNIDMGRLILLYAIVVFAVGVKKMFFESNKGLSIPLQYGALGIAGIMQGMFLAGACFIVVYALEKIHDKQEFRASLSVVWALLNTYLLYTYQATEQFTPEVIKLSALCIVPLVIAIILGNKVVKRINQKVFLQMTYGILIISGIILFVSSI